MITGEIKNKIDSIWDDFFSAGMSEYLTVIEQFSYLMFIHSLDEVENETEQYEKLPLSFFFSDMEICAGVKMTLLPSQFH